MEIIAEDGNRKHVVCVLAASNYVGFWVLKGLLDKGYTVHAGVQQYGDGLEPVGVVRIIREMERSFEERLKLWYALSKTLSEQAVWALSMDRHLNMVSINYGLVLGPNLVQQNPLLTLSYLKGAPEMYENGVLATVDVDFLVDVHIRAFEDHSTCGRYLGFDKVVNNEEEAIKLAKNLSPLIPLPPRYECQGNEVSAERLRSTKLNKLVEGTAY